MAKDLIHDAVKEALIKDDWHIIAEHLRIEYEEIEIFVDLVAEPTPILAEKEGRQIIIEIKTFAGPSFVREFQQAIGQYELYLDVIQLTNLEYKLYLAISEFIYNDFFLRKATHEIVQRHQIKLLVVNVERKEVIQWIE
jgi:XisH protein